ncbi:hypothetical protein [Lipingzhangella halophila]|uniref:hypothetical protein n=1 Tax=Lipingzhangella halophila TaxID=1783352 RepID=UPI0028AB797C|nr:hypothetical protein [Lipingzhangella halophila]
MNVGTPASGAPAMAGPGQRLDASNGENGGFAWSRALLALSAELRSRGLAARIDDAVGAVDAADRASARRTQRAVLRPHRGRLWWWLRWAGEPTAAARHIPLAPATETARAAQRIARLLARG